MTRLRVDPPRWLKSADAAQAGGGLDLTLTLADGADAKVSDGDGATFVNLFSAKAPEPADAKAASAKAADARPPRPSPRRRAGPIRLRRRAWSRCRRRWRRARWSCAFRGGRPWARRCSAGDAVWVVFDAAARLDLSAAPHGFRQATGFQAVQGADYSAVRIASPPTSRYRPRPRARCGSSPWRPMRARRLTRSRWRGTGARPPRR